MMIPMTKMALITLICSSILLVSCSSRRKRVRIKRPLPVPVKEEKTATKKEMKKVKKTHWGYTGTEGPAYWSTLDSKYSTCTSGKQQSPIDLVWQQPASKSPIPFFYKKGDFAMHNNGHAIQAYVPKGNKVTVQGQLYELLQVHFHNESEHEISSRRYPLEAHFVHKNLVGDLAVIGVLFVVGAHNPALDSILASIPEKGLKKEGVGSFNPLALMPVVRTHYQYMGSLTTPPCSEGVLWTVFNTPVSLSQSQFERIKKYYTGNRRPVQPLNGRTVINY